MADKIQIEINNIPLQVNVGDRLIDVADKNGINIPRFCYHKKLTVSANCRMCLVEVENAPKLVPACATLATDGMKVFTKSKKALDAQKSVMEFLLINHPLDCPVCDQGGECDLQDLAVAYGNDFSRYNEPKRIVKNKNLGTLIATDMTRCIHCTRCVRFGKEIAGIVEMGGLGRGEHMEIGTYIEKSLSSELSGNIIDLCPVGALTSKPFRFQARNWELTNTQSIAPHDALGSNIIIQSINNKVVRVLPDDNEAINEIWLSDRDRFSYLGLYSKDRLETPMVRNKNGNLEPISWQNALDIASNKLQESIKNDKSLLGIVMSPSSTTEEFYLTYKITDTLNIKNITCRLPHANTVNIASSMSCKITDIENMDTIVIIGSDIQREIPLLSHRIRKASNNGASIHLINDQSYPSTFSHISETHSADEMMQRLKDIAICLEDSKQADKDIKKIIKSLQSAKKILILVGQVAGTSSNFNQIYKFAQTITKLTNAEFAFVDIGANTQGAMVAGLYQTSQILLDDLLKHCSTLLTFGTEIGLDSGKNFDKLLAQKDFIVSCSAYLSDELKEYADLVLPMATFAETSGTFVNIQNDWQSFKGAVKPLGEARPGWKILRVLANHLNLPGFEFIDSSEVLEECKKFDKYIEPIVPNKISEYKSIQLPTIYEIDSLVRRSDALQTRRKL